LVSPGRRHQAARRRPAAWAAVAGPVLAALAIGGCGGVQAPAKATARTVARPARSRAAASARRARRAERTALRRFTRYGRPVYCGGIHRPYVALTFDDGPGVYTRLALRILRRFHRRATFFLVGRNLAPFHGLAARDAQAGAVGDHTWTHPYLPGLAPAAIRQQLRRTQAAVRRAAHTPVRLFRTPYGAHDGFIDRTARRLGMVEILWNVDSADSLGANWLGIWHNVRSGLHPGAIVLMHENHGQTIRALRYRILPYLRRRHLHIVTVPQLLALDPPTPAQLRAGPRGCRGIGGGRLVGAS
jgi:peptidoglycan/xylan/chitin deacetylase (PgdA/CDA1 family)